MKYTAIYGNVKIQKAYCKSCKTYAFVIKGIKQCCDKPVEQRLSQIKKIVVAPQQKRLKPKKKEQEFILFTQNEKCLYCEKEFGTLYERNGKLLKTKLNWDHYIPYSFSFNNRKTNFVAACHICNGIKSNKMFDTLDDAKAYVEYQIKRRQICYLEN